MRNATKIPMAAIALTATLLLSISSVWAQESISGRHNISELFTIAQRTFDLSKEDAVLLLDSKEIQWLPDKRLEVFIHRIIWINTDWAIDHYGDHRIPYDEAYCSFNVETVRTWRDGRWWETGPTGIVETFPFALRRAYDYANMHEMMMLHNGIELPCILEVAYSIEDKEPFRKGVDGIWLSAREEPAVQSLFSLGVPKGQQLNAFTSADIPEAEKTIDEESGLDIYLWKMGPLRALARPHADDPAAYTPHIVWSTWKDWSEYGDQIRNTFKSAMTLDDSLKNRLDSLIDEARIDAEKGDLIADFVSQRTSLIEYPEHYWRTWPRSALRTYETAYGHGLDRAILAAALFKEAGLQTEPAFLGTGYDSIDEGVPTLSRMDGVGVWVSGENIEAYYDPRKSTITEDLAHISGRTVWLPGVDNKPGVRLDHKEGRSRIDVLLDLSYDADKDTFKGTGFLNADNCLSPYGRMKGLSGEAKSFLESVVSGILEGASITDHNASLFDPSAVITGFEFTLKKPEEDDLGRLSFEIGEPDGGLFAHLPDDVHLYQQRRNSSIGLQGLMSQKVTLKLDLKDMDIVYLPNEQTVENLAGSFTITVVQKDDHLTIMRELNLAKTDYRPDEWLALRELLLADRHERNRTLLMKGVTGSETAEGKEEIEKQ